MDRQDTLPVAMSHSSIAQHDNNERVGPTSTVISTRTACIGYNYE